MSLARHSPETTKLPDRSPAPAGFVISSDSPVMRASFTCTLPSTTCASAGIWLPALRIIISSSTSFSTATSFSRPSLTTWLLGILRSLSLSKVCLDLISWAIPITVFARTISIKDKSLNDPTITSKTPSTVNIKLKYVKTFSLTISLTVLVEELT